MNNQHLKPDIKTTSYNINIKMNPTDFTYKKTQIFTDKTKIGQYIDEKNGVCHSSSRVSGVTNKISDNICCGSKYVPDKFHICAAIQINQIRISATCHILAARFRMIMFTRVFHGSNFMTKK